ncbi:MAG: dephospho-CoA kinase [Cocleimonas sp.]
MLKVGLTGGIGCGKSTVANAFCALGVSIIDADIISKSVVNAGQPALQKIEQAFGEGIILPSGELNREKLKKIIFTDSTALEKLEQILHPIIRQEITKQMTEHLKEPYIIVDVPLLVEKEYQSLFDKIIVVDCTLEQQIERVLKRDEMTENDVIKIIKTQADRDYRKRFATDLIDNSKRIDHVKAQVNTLHNIFMAPPPFFDN